jgi:hypothetical protein
MRCSMTARCEAVTDRDVSQHAVAIVDCNSALSWLLRADSQSVTTLSRLAGQLMRASELVLTIEAVVAPAVAVADTFAAALQRISVNSARGK